MVGIYELIRKRKNYPIEKNNDAWLEEILSSDIQEQVCIVLPEGFLSLYSWEGKRNELQAKYNIYGAYQLNSPFVNKMVQMILLDLRKAKCDKVIFGFFDKDVYDNRRFKRNRNDALQLPDKFSSEYDVYLSQVENVISNDVIEQSEHFRVIPIEEIDHNKIYPHYYTESAMTVRKLLKKEALVKLSDVADVIRPKLVEDRACTGKQLFVPDMKYPLIVDDIREKTITDYILQKGDIVLSMSGNKRTPYLFPGSDVPIYANPNMLVIKCKSVSPEYLCLYLPSKTAQQIMDTFPTAFSDSRITMSSLIDLPVIKPTLKTDEYMYDYNVLVEYYRKDYQEEMKTRSRLMLYAKKFSDNKKSVPQAETLEDILNMELASRIKMHKAEQLRSFLTDDLKELNICFRGHAYKATLILAGSILEAVLIDWLSEIHECDYFKKDYCVTDKNGRRKKAHLMDYIDAIKEIERPNWIDEANKAHEIRKRRNLVHAKLCINSDVVNEDICRQVIGYLEDVLKTRGVEKLS